MIPDDFDEIFKLMLKRYSRYLSGKPPETGAGNDSGLDDSRKVISFGISLGNKDNMPAFTWLGNPDILEEHVGQEGYEKRKSDHDAGKKIEEPFYESYNGEGGNRLVNVDLPGATDEDVHVEIRDERLHVEAETGSRHFSLSLPVPADISNERVNWHMNNGILEVRMEG